MTKIYHKTFGVSELDRERDEALALRMTALKFIKPSHLDIPELYRDEKSWILAMKELHKINNYKVSHLLKDSAQTCTSVTLYKNGSSLRQDLWTWDVSMFAGEQGLLHFVLIAAVHAGSS